MASDNSPMRVSVEYTLSCPSSSDRFTVLTAEMTEELGRPYEVRLQLVADSDEIDTLELLGRDVRFTLSRGRAARDVEGVVTRVELRDNAQLHQSSMVTIEPALVALKLTKNTRVFQNLNAATILEQVMSDGLAPYGRTIDSAALEPDAYATREYCVQYQETDFDFVHRLMEEEGLGYFFEHRDHECLCLFARSQDLVSVSTSDGYAVRFDPMLRSTTLAEPLLRFCPATQLAPTSVAVRDHDWTRARPMLESERGGDDVRNNERAHEVYEHGFERHLSISEDAELLATMLSLVERAAMPNGLPAGLNRRVLELRGAVLDGFSSCDAKTQAQIRRERLRRDARTADGTSVVTNFSVGRKFQLIGHPTLGADGTYLLTKLVHESSAPEFPGGGVSPVNYHNTFECIPIDVPWRPLHRTRKPRVYGVQTARVTAPLGMDVHTDQHGRIKVKFNWDRSEEDLAGAHTCWIRVSQNWAGNTAPGFVFIPRVGMEVVVAFVDGDPDRPLVTGCVYNASNATPGMLPVEATKSIIRTRTVPHGVGYNELSFEDAMGMERVYVRAQRDLEELVLRDHEALVKGDKSSQVLGSRVESTGGSRTTAVEGDNSESTHGSMLSHISGEDRRIVVGSSTLRVGTSQSVSVDHGSRVVRVLDGEHVLMSSGRMVVSQGGENHIVFHTNDDAEVPKGVRIESPNAITFTAGDATVTMNEDGAGGVTIDSPTEIKLTVGGSALTISPGLIQANGKTFPA